MNDSKGQSSTMADPATGPARSTESMVPHLVALGTGMAVFALRYVLPVSDEVWSGWLKEIALMFSPAIGAALVTLRNASFDANSARPIVKPYLLWGFSGVSAGLLVRILGASERSEGSTPLEGATTAAFTFLFLAYVVVPLVVPFIRLWVSAHRRDRSKRVAPETFRQPFGVRQQTGRSK